MTARALQARPWIVAVLMAAGAAGAWAQGAPRHEPPSAANATSHARTSDADRTFLRAAAGRFAHDRALSELARTHSRRKEILSLAVRWRAQADRLQQQVVQLSAQHKTEVPLDQTDQGEARLRELGSLKGAAFDEAFLRHAASTLGEEVRLFEDAQRRSENEAVRRWAADSLAALRQTLAAVEKVLPR